MSSPGPAVHRESQVRAGCLPPAPSYAPSSGDGPTPFFFGCEACTCVSEASGVNASQWATSRCRRLSPLQGAEGPGDGSARGGDGSRWGVRHVSPSARPPQPLVAQYRLSTSVTAPNDEGGEREKQSVGEGRERRIATLLPSNEGAERESPTVGELGQRGFATSPPGRKPSHHHRGLEVRQRRCGHGLLGQKLFQTCFPRALRTRVRTGVLTSEG